MIDDKKKNGDSEDQEKGGQASYQDDDTNITDFDEETEDETMSPS